jgi:hypothetical protein
MRLISLEKMIRTQQYVYACRKQLSANDTTVVVSRSTVVADAVWDLFQYGTLQPENLLLDEMYFRQSSLILESSCSNRRIPSPLFWLLV